MITCVVSVKLRDMKIVWNIQNTKSLVSQRSLLSIDFNDGNDLNKQVREGKIRIAAFIAEHNLAFSVANHLTELLKNVATDLEIAWNLTCSRTKWTGIVKNVMVASNLDKLVEELKNNNFGSMVDESTDKECTKHMALVVHLKKGNTTKDQQKWCLL